MTEQGQAIRDKVRGFVTTNFYVADPAQLTDASSLLEQGIVDSTGVMELVGFVEAEYGFKVDDEEVVPDNLDSIDAIVGFVTRKSA